MDIRKALESGKTANELIQEFTAALHKEVQDMARQKTKVDEARMKLIEATEAYLVATGLATEEEIAAIDRGAMIEAYIEMEKEFLQLSKTLRTPVVDHMSKPMLKMTPVPREVKELSPQEVEHILKNFVGQL